MWTMVDLHVWRAFESNIPQLEIPNGDNTCFSPYKYSEFPKEIIFRRFYSEEE